MTPESLLQIGTLVLSLTAISMQVVRWNGGERKKLLKESDSAAGDASEAIAKAAETLIAPMEARIAKLEEENKQNRAQIAKLMNENEHLTQIIEKQAERIGELEHENAYLRKPRDNA